ncbi:MAG: efflux RND transporter permease subunit, partial [Bacteroidota bacterium]
SRTRILEKLNALPDGTLPEGIQPQLGPDATALGQIFWYTLEGRDGDGNPTGGWDPHELRSIQDFQVKYALSSAKGVAEVASIGGYVQEYQVDIDPAAMRESNVSVTDIASAIRKSNRDVGARTLEMNRAEYVVRGRGQIESLSDIEESVVAVRDGNTPLRIRDVARVSMGPAQRRGMLDKGGTEAVGGVAVARYGENPLEVIENVKSKIEEIAPGLPSKTLDDGTESQVDVVPFYDRAGLIYETLGTLEEALSLQILITIIVIMIMVMHLRSSFIVSALLPVAVLVAFILMRYVGVDANVVALAGIAISIGTVVDMGIIMTENMLTHLDEAHPNKSRRDVIFEAASEVSPAVITALATTIVSFLPVFLLQAEEGRLFGPLAWTKTFVLLAALVITLALIPPFAHWLFTRTVGRRWVRTVGNGALVVGGAVLWFWMAWAGFILVGLGALGLAVRFADRQSRVDSQRLRAMQPYIAVGIIVLGLGWLLADVWLPLGPDNPRIANLLFVIGAVGSVLGVFLLFQRYYERMMRLFIARKALFLSIPLLLLVAAVFSAQTLDREFMPTLDEGSFLLMPTAMPHAGSEETIDQMRGMDMRVNSIPEVDMVVGKAGRAESALDPAPLSMFETVIQYKSEYRTDESGQRLRFRVDDEGDFVRDNTGALIPDADGRYYRQWRDHIQSKDDIWDEIVQAADLPGLTSAPRLQPIETRLTMLQTGMRAPIGVQVFGPDLDTIDDVSIQIESIVDQTEGVRSGSAYADRVAGKPYLELDIDRPAIARHGLTIDDVQEVIRIAIGGQPLTTTVEGRERYPVRVRYARENRSTPEQIERILVPTPTGRQITLGQLVDLEYVEGPMTIRSEDTFLVNYVTFDAAAGTSAVEAAANVRAAIEAATDRGDLDMPSGVTYRMAGEFEDQQRAANRLALIIPITLLLIFLL